VRKKRSEPNPNEKEVINREKGEKDWERCEGGELKNDK
jgi:hypothetical protein